MEARNQFVKLRSKSIERHSSEVFCFACNGGVPIIRAKATFLDCWH